MSRHGDALVIEVTRDEWYYVASNASCSANAFDWRDDATAVGPFSNGIAASLALQRCERLSGPERPLPESHKRAAMDETLEFLIKHREPPRWYPTAGAVLQERQRRELDAKLEPARQARYAADRALHAASEVLTRLSDGALAAALSALAAHDELGELRASLGAWATARTTARVRAEEATQLAKAAGIAQVYL